MVNFGVIDFPRIRRSADQSVRLWLRRAFLFHGLSILWIPLVLPVLASLGTPLGCRPPFPPHRVASCQKRVNTGCRCGECCLHRASECTCASAGAAETAEERAWSSVRIAVHRQYSVRC